MPSRRSSWRPSPPSTGWWGASGPANQPNMTRTEDLRHRALFVFYYALVVLSAAGLLLHSTPHAIRHPLLVPGMVLLLMLMADAKPVPLPSGGYATASGLFDLPSLVVL